MYTVRMVYLERLRFASSRTLICSAKSLSCFTFPEAFSLQSKESEKRWQCLKLQTSNFHTMQRLHAPLHATLVMSTVLQGGSIIGGFMVRRWWLKKTPMEREKYKSLYWERRNVFFGFLGIFSLVLLTYYLSHFERDPILQRRRFIALSKEEQESLGNILYSTLLLRFKEEFVPVNNPLYMRLVRVIRKLANANRDIFKNTDWTVNIVNTPLPNAMVLQNRNVFVFSGIFNLVENDDQLLFILAHEMSHVLLQHVIELMSYSMMKEFILSIPSFFIWACFSNWMALCTYVGCRWLYNILFIYPYKRRLEFEADEVGLQLAAKSCIDVREVLVFWERMLKYSDITGDRKREILMTHPDHKSRQMRLARQMPKVLELQNQVGCPPLPEKDPRDNLERSLRELEKFYKEKKF